MKEYTVDFEADYIEAENDKEASKIILSHVDENYALWKDDIIGWREGPYGRYYWDNPEDDPAEPPLQTYQIEFNPLYVKAKNSDIAMNKAEKYAEAHGLTIVDIDDGYEI